MTSFQNPFKCIYSEEIELKLKHSGTHAAFFDLDIEIEDEILVYKLFVKREKFPFFIVRIPHFESNIPSTIFYGSICLQFLCIGQVYFLDWSIFYSELYNFFQGCYRKGQIKVASIKRF